MRSLLMLLILANLAVFAWFYWIAPSGGDGLPLGRVDTRLGKGLVLVEEAAAVAMPEVTNESEAAAREEYPAEAPLAEAGQSEPLQEVSPEELFAEGEGDEPAALPVESALPEPAPVCATLGPFDRLEMAQLAHERLSTMGYTPALRESGGQIRSGFWVYLPPFTSRNQAKQAEARLREKGVQDLFIVTGAEQRNAISLGLFSTPERADQRAAEIGRLGFAPRIAERFRDATVYWLDFREDPARPLEPEAIGVPGADETLPEKRSIPCDGVYPSDKNGVENIAEDGAAP